MKPSSLDLRERAAAHREGSWRAIARRFRASLSFTTRRPRRYRRTGDLKLAPHGGGHPPALDDAVPRATRCDLAGAAAVLAPAL